MKMVLFYAIKGLELSLSRLFKRIKSWRYYDMSKSMEWGDALLTHVGDMDDQHKKLIEIMNKLHESFHSKTHGDIEGVTR